jgi:Mce-associated membrane protein
VAGLRKPEADHVEPAAVVAEPAVEPVVEDVSPEPESAPTPAPRPVGRRKRVAEQVPDSVLAPAPSVTEEKVPRSGGYVLPLALVVVAALLVGLGVWFQSRAGDVRLNNALLDSAGTTEVSGQAREAVEKAFSYNFTDVASTEKAANELLVGKAKCQYNAIFGPVRTLAPEQKLVVTVRVVSSGVTYLEGDRATVLLFLDQITTRTTDNQSGGGIAMMRVGTQRVDGRWKVDNMEMFGQTGEQTAEMQKCADAK